MDLRICGFAVGKGAEKHNNEPAADQANGER
jgi:hypothetical protein